MLVLVSDIDVIGIFIDKFLFDILAKEKLAKVADDVKASGKKNIVFKWWYEIYFDLYSSKLC